MAKIMLVEDDNNLREIYEARLMAEGYDIVSARDGEEALAVAVREKPDLIISDVMMPKISGFDMLDILRSTPETKNTKVIMMTALSQAEDKARAEKLGADRYLVKSQVTLEDVAKVAREVLAGDAVSGDAPLPIPAADPVPAAPAPIPIPAPEPAPLPTPAAPAPMPAVPIPVTDDATASLVSTANIQTVPTAGVTDLVPAAAAPAPAPAPTPHVEVDIEKTAAELWAAPAAESAPVPDATSAASTAEAKVNAAPSQSLADEEAAIAKQIESFIDKPVEVAADPVPAAPAPIPIPAPEPAPLPTPAAPAPMPAAPVAGPEVTPTAATSAPSDSPSPKAGGEKVIQPINDLSKPNGSNLDELVAKEVAKNQTTGNVIDPNSLAL